MNNDNNNNNNGQTKLHIQVRSDNKSGYPGVCYEPRCNKWRAYIDIGKYKKSLGYFSNKTDAINARIQAESSIKK